MDIAVQTVDLTKRFPKGKSYLDILLRPFARHETRALQSISLTVKTGDSFALVGPNGAGKTTLIKILSTLILPTVGEAFVAGYDVKRQANQIKKRAGCVVAEERSFFWRLTGRQNLSFFAVLNNIPGKRVDQRVSEAIALVGLEEDADKMFKNYSTGMRHRLAIARALLTDPEILFFDEPTKSLDPPTAESIRRLISSFASREPKRTVLFATHDLMEAERLADRIAILDRGTVKACGTPAELRESVSTKKRYSLKVCQPSEQVVNLLGRLAPPCEAIEDDAPRQGSYTVEVGDPSEVSKLLKELMAAGAEVFECVAVKPSLAEIFDALTAEHA